MKLLYANDQLGEHAPSWYFSSSLDDTRREPLEQSVKAEVCVIGAGYTGLAAALSCARRNISCVVLDAHRVGWGASGRNGGQLGTGFNKDQIELEQLLGKPAAHDLWHISESAKQWIADICQQYSVDNEHQPGIVYAQHRQRFVKPLHDYCRKLAKDYDYPHFQPLDATEIRQHVASEDYKGGALDHGAAHIHPLKFAQGLAGVAESCGAVIHEGSEVLKVLQEPTGRHRVLTAGGSVSCGTVIMACNGYQDGLNTTLGKHLMPINNFIVVTQPIGLRAEQLLPFNEAVADSRFVVNYFRRVDGDRLLFGGGENYRYRFPDNIEQLVQRAMLGIFPQLDDVAIDYAWGGTLAITRNRLPYVRQLSPGILCAGGYSGHGVALAAICGHALAEKIAGNEKQFHTLSQIPFKTFPGGQLGRSALLALAMSAYSWMDRL